MFLGTDIKLQRPVVIKVLSPQLAAAISTERFAREVRVASTLQQANIVPVFSSGVAAGLPYYTMPFVEGMSLRTRLAQGQQTSASEVIAILTDIARALAYAHEHGVVHRDIKPDNVLLSGGAAVVTDFGIARALSDSTATSTNHTLTEVGMAIGTPAYMSPEQASGDDVDPRSDVYSWGIIAYELLSGKHPFDGRAGSAALIRAHIAEKPKSIGTRPDIPRPLFELVTRALEKDPALRPANGRDLCAQLAQVASGTSSVAARAHSPRRRWLAAGVAVAVLAIGTVLLSQKREGGFQIVSDARADPVKSIAVLPFVNVGSDPNQEYFSDGVTDEIADALARLPGVRLASRTSAFAFKGRKDLDVKAIGSKLNVGTLVEGQVARAGNTIRVSTQLTDAKSGIVLWRNKYEREVTGVFAVQEEIARSIATALQVPLTGAPSLAAGTTNIEAHDLYLRGRFEHDKFTERSLRKAISLYDSATKLDPNYIAAYAYMSLAWTNMADDFMAPVEAQKKAGAAAQKALSIDPMSPMANLAHLLATFYQSRDFAVTQSHRVVEMSPNDPLALTFAGLAIFAHDPKTGLEWGRRAMQLDPQSPFTGLIMVWITMDGGDVVGALRMADAREATDSVFPPYHFVRGEALMAVGRFRDALNSYKRISTSLPSASKAGQARAYAALGKRDSAITLLHELERDSRNHYVSKDYIAEGYTELGMKDEAFKWLEAAVEDHANYVRFLKVKDVWKPLRGDPRYDALIRKLGL